MTLTAGGGVYILDNGTFDMVGGKITGNSASVNGNAMRIRGVFNWWGGTIENNSGTGDVLYKDSAGTINNPHHFTAS